MSDLEIIKEFLVESYENLDRLDRDLVALENCPNDREILASVFRTIHTIKGTSGFLAFGKLEAVTHVGENLLARLRDGQLVLNPEITTALLAMVDAVRQILATIENSGKEGERDDSALIARLSELQQRGTVETVAPPRTAPEVRTVPTGTAPADNRDKICVLQPNDAVEKVNPPNSHEKQNTIRIQEDPAPTEVLKTTDVNEIPNVQQQARGQSASDSAIRVDVSLLDQLMNLVGELVLARNQILQFTNSTEESGLLATSQRLNLITTELQEGVMKTRMQPIGNIWSKFPRTVRDVALGCGKRVRIEMEGKDTELDKTIIEAIKDPLTHLVRNAVDHGIECPEVREAAGKNPEGCLLLRAFHEGGQVNIEITDDGAGLDFEKIRKKAIQKGVASADQAARMSDREITNLIFMPGFSTAEKVTNVSGRGVGMDVVKTNIEKIGGTVDVQSRAGQGSTVRMKIPLTLAIIPALIVTSAGDHYAIPQVSLLELVRLEGEQARKGIEMVQGAPVYRLRGRLLPLVYLDRELKSGGETQIATDPRGATTSKRDFLDFVMARNKHSQWMSRLKQLLEGKLMMTLEEAGSHSDCALGKWLYSSGLKEYGDVPEMAVLEEMHKQFHNLVRDVVTSILAGHQKQAEHELSNVASLSGKVIELLTILEKKILRSENVNIVVLQADDRQFGLVVDDINDTEEIVVKPLSKQLKSINIYAGATIMGDGKVALILDVLGLAQCANVVSGAHDHALAEAEKATEARDGGGRKSVLLFQYGEKGRMAIDLSMVARLEEFPTDAVEIADGQEAVQYRGQILPLIRVSEVLQTERVGASQSNQSIQVVVYADTERSIGLVIDRILDIAEESFVIERQTDREGVLGSAVIQKRITDVLDVPGLIAAAKGSAKTMAAHA